MDGVMSFLLLFGIQYVVHSYSSRTLEILKTIGRQQCSRECLHHYDCDSIIYYRDLLQCYMMAGNNQSAQPIQGSKSQYIPRFDIPTTLLEGCRNENCNGTCVDLTHSDEECVPTRCDDPLPATGGATLDWRYYQVGVSNAPFQCPSTLEGVGEQNSATCDLNGVWAPANYTCVGSLYVSSVSDFSSQYLTYSYSASDIIGPPDVYPNYEDSPNAFLPKYRTANEYISVVFAQELYIYEVHIYETYHAGSVIQLDIKNGTTWVKVWETATAQDITQSRIFKPSFPTPTFKSKEVKIYMDLTVANTYVEIDAVKILGSL